MRYGETWKLTRKRVRLVPQFPVLPNSLTLAEYIRAWRLNADGCDSMNDTATLTAESSTLLGQPARMLLGNLSHGQKRLLEILLACAARTAAIFADEPLAGLAQDRVAWCVEKLNKFRADGGALLVVAHRPEQQHWKADWQCEVFPA